MALSKKDIEFLEDLELRLLAQANAKTKNIKDKMLISGREFSKFWNVLEKIENDYNKNKKLARERNAEKRKTDKTYGYSYAYKQYRKDKEEAQKQGIKFTKKLKDYEQKEA